ncbi:2-oxoacid:acceptor oxidoreductase subunit alpha [Telmatospirillum sp.]|uniref:2-oxoacid:acceptor oxidoreductase subunit alpha n=1 Tax=Telmatospirillum sp. TaxID=2079197 RepID=UPI00284F838B|nr:2-oxoacid:acceptor oxidoreductase subunit alpha [Telmatospirillum sp.]MDR3439214.1 2-oxoacid:acceptor oxidoreductase subunit alpha [Telmatospirillum sp.]
MAAYSVSVALTGSGGAGSMTAGQILLDSASKAGFYGLMTRSMGPQIRGGEAAALVRISSTPISSLDDHYDLLIAFDWGNISRFAAELPLSTDSLILCDPAQGPVPDSIATYGARVAPLALKALSERVHGGRGNMIGLGAVAALIGLPIESVLHVLATQLGRKGEEVLAASTASVKVGAEAATLLPPMPKLPEGNPHGASRWNISGNEAAGLGALKGGIKFVAAYPITPATEVLEWLAPALEKTGGALIQAEDELASINMVIGGAFAGLPSLTATSGPGLSLMTESIGLAVASETPLVVVDVMRGGPSTGIPTKSEQSDLNIAVYGLHGDAPHLVVAPNSSTDCLAATQWSVYLAEALQSPAIVLSDQAMGQSRVIIDKPAESPYVADRLVADADIDGYQRYALTESGISPMAIPGTPGSNYVADGLEHNERGTPSSQASDHLAQLDKRARKLQNFDYGDNWADVEGDGEIAVITWGSVTGPVREALDRARAKGIKAKLISLRLILPALPERMDAALAGVNKVLVVEQSHSQQFNKFLRGHYDLPADVSVFSRPGPLPIRPGEILTRLAVWE